MSKDKNQTTILLIYLLTSIFVGILAARACGSLINNTILYKNYLLCLYFLLSIWLFKRRFGNFGLGLLTSIVLLIAISYVGFYLFLFTVFFLLLCVLEDIFDLGLISGKMRNYLLGDQDTDQNEAPGKKKAKTRLKKSKKNQLRPGNNWSVVDLVMIPLTAFIFALISLSATNRGYANFLYDYELLYSKVHDDGLWHVTQATIFKNYWRMSNALHGLPTFRYHVFSHFLYGRAADLLDITVYQAYGYANFMVFIPLLFVSILFLSEQLSSSDKSWKFFISTSILISVFIGFFGADEFAKFAVWNSYISSESYCIALILFMAFLSYLMREREAESQLNFLLIIFTFILTMGFAKLSLGIMGSVCFMIREVFFTCRKVVYKVLVMVGSPLVSLLYLAFYQSQGGLTYEPLYFFHTYVGNPNNLGKPWDFLLFLLIHYFFAWLAMIIMLFYYLNDKAEYENFKKLFVFFVIVTILSYAPLMVGVDSGYYFSTIPMFMALPILLSIKNKLSFKALNVLEKPKPMALLFAAIFLWGIYGDLKFGWEYMTNIYNNYKYKATSLAYRVSFDPGISGYLVQLKKIEKDPSTRDYLVYIPKKETKFWNITEERRILTFIIPVVSGRPAIYSLPNEDWKVLLGFAKGYNLYSQEVYRISQKSEVDDKTLRKETSRLGFNGYIIVSESSFQKVACQ